MLCDINVKFNWILEEHPKFVSEAYLSNLSLDEDQMPDNLQPGLEKDIIQGTVSNMDGRTFLSGETTLHQDEKTTTSEVDSFPKMLDLIRMIIYVFLTS